MRNEKAKRVKGIEKRTVTELNALPGQAFMTTEEVGLYAVLSGAALRIRRSCGNGPRFYKNRNIIRYRKSDVDNWLTKSSNSEVA